MHRRALFNGLAAAAAALLTALPAQADTYPSRPVTIIVPFAPGGGSDVVARAIAPILGAKLGGTVVVENVSGAAGTIAATRVSRADPDGYTLIIHNIAFALNAAFAPKSALTPANFTPITMVNSTPGVLVGRTTLPVNTVPELVAYAKKNRLRVGHPGVGSSGHLSVSLMLHALGAEADYIPYRGGGPQLQDTIAGHIDIVSVVVANGLEPIRTGQVKGVGTLSKKRHPLLPQVPSFYEDLNPLSESLFWNVLMAPPGTPKEIVQKIHLAYEEALKDPTLITSFQRSATDLYTPEQRTPEGTIAYLKSEFENWARVIPQLKIEGPRQ
ncbi:MAG: tripartite tricarboxylate transporter substrate binding protein [Variibacter sp.]|nr:tripartite tricarboxylate transporter substrate binding protein [Variibacter sp.]